MQARQLLHKLVLGVCGEMHVVRRAALEDTVWAALSSQRLTVAGLGRSLKGTALEKHSIKRADRLLSNAHLQAERIMLYTALARRIIGRQRHPVLLVDWSDLDKGKQNQLLRASMVAAGRALTIYEEVHSSETAVKPRTHRQFLKRLQAMLPPGCKPVLVSDAGFKTPWFKAVETLGWYWVARVRGSQYFQHPEEDSWLPINSLHSCATKVPQSLGEVRLARSQSHPCRMVLYKGKSKGRHAFTHTGARSRSIRSIKAARAGREPWVLATNLPLAGDLAKKVVQIYRTRMQIEEAFRDLKSARFGLALEFHLSRNKERLAVLLLIAALALVLLWIIGTAAQRRGLTRNYQANTIRKRTVLSVIYLGIRIIERARDSFSAAEVGDAWRSIPLQNAALWAAGC